MVKQHLVCVSVMSSSDMNHHSSTSSTVVKAVDCGLSVTYQLPVTHEDFLLRSKVPLSAVCASRASTRVFQMVMLLGTEHNTEDWIKTLTSHLCRRPLTFFIYTILITLWLFVLKFHFLWGDRAWLHLIRTCEEWKGGGTERSLFTCLGTKLFQWQNMFLYA